MLTLFFMINPAVAEQLVIYSSQENLNSELQPQLDEDAEKVLWADVQNFPLNFHGVTPKGKCVGIAKTTKEIEESLNKVVSALNYLELEKAVGHVNRIENDFLCLEEIVPAEILSRSYFLSGVTYYYDEDMDKTTEEWKQAITLNPSVEWDDQIEPSGKKLFTTIKEEVQTVATAQLVLYPSNSKVVLDGKERMSGDDIPAGRHLAQHETTKMKSYWIEVEPGNDVTMIALSSFDKLDTLMADSNGQQEILTALSLVRPDTDIRIITEQDLWYVPTGSDNWSKVDLQQAIKDNPNSTVKNTKAKALLISSAASLALGGTSFVMAKKSHDQYLATEDPVAANNIYAMNRLWFYSGIGLGVSAGGLLVGGVIQW